MTIVYTLAAALVVMLVSLAGAITSANTLHKWFENKLHYLVSFAAGVFLVVSYNIFSEIAHESSYSWAFMLVIIGLLAFFVLDKFLPESHHHHEPGCKHPHSKKGGLRILYADSLHNVVDGIILFSSFAVNFSVGVVVTVGILVHETIQEVSEFFVLKEAGFTTKQALARNFAVSATILVGVLLGLLLSSFESIIPILLGVAGGGFLHIVFVDLLPRQLKKCAEKNCMAKHLSWALVGIIVMLLVGLLGTHS